MRGCVTFTNNEFVPQHQVVYFTLNKALYLSKEVVGIATFTYIIRLHFEIRELQCPYYKQSVILKGCFRFGTL